MKKSMIGAATIARITDKAKNLIGWAVKSDSENKYYLVRAKKIGKHCFWICDCQANKHGYNGFCTKGRCKHVKAVIEVGAARKELRQAEQEAQRKHEEALEALRKEIANKQELASNRRNAGREEFNKVKAAVNEINAKYSQDKAAIEEQAAAVAEAAAIVKKAASAAKLNDLPLNGNVGFNLMRV